MSNHMKLKCKDCSEIFVCKPTDIIKGREFTYVYCPVCNNAVLVDISQVKDDKC